MYAYRPFGHPDTLCPGGTLWQQKKAAGEWAEWSNKPWQLDFHALGADNNQRMLMAANRPGKTRSAAMEVAFHLTGEYPDWWTGRRFNSPVHVWTGSPTNETSRDIVQKELLGGMSTEQFGTGSVPKEKLHNKPKMKQAGIADVVDTFQVRHVSGGISTCTLKTYEQGWRKWQGTAPEVVWMDEEPEVNEAQGKIRTEATTRLLTSKGILLVTFTPLQGVTPMVEYFQQGGEGVALVTATWDDAPHILPHEARAMAAAYPEHERDARTKGVPMLGSGRVFPFPEEDLKVRPFPIPAHFFLLKGIDFGLNHPAAVVDIAWDRDKDIIYLTRAWKRKIKTIDEHEQAINMTHPSVPVAWPHDGINRQKGSVHKGQLISQYTNIKRLSRSARYQNDVGGAQPVEPILMELQQLMGGGGFKAFSTCGPFWEEYRMYHRKEGILTKMNDDVMKALFYAVMMRRFAITLSWAQDRGARTASRPHAPICRAGM